MTEEKLVIKILKLLSKWFDMKVKTIEKVQDASKMKVDMLIGTLLTFEMAINDKLEKKSKSVAFNIDGEECDD